MTVAFRRPGALDPADLSSSGSGRPPAGEREKTFAELRANRSPGTAPCTTACSEDPNDQGFWAVVRHADLVEVTRRPQDFLSGEGILFESMPKGSSTPGQASSPWIRPGTPRSAG